MQASLPALREPVVGAKWESRQGHDGEIEVWMFVDRDVARIDRGVARIEERVLVRPHVAERLDVVEQGGDLREELDVRVVARLPRVEQIPDRACDARRVT